MQGVEHFSEALAECRDESSFEERLSCEEDVSKKFKEELASRGKFDVDGSKDAFDTDTTKAVLRTLDKTSNQVEDVNMIKSRGGGVVEVRTGFGESDFFVKQDEPENIAWTKQVRNITDVVEDDSSTVLHQDLNSGVVVLSDEGDSPAEKKNIEGMEAGMAAVTESIILDNDRNKKNLASENGVISEIDFDRSLVERVPVTELAQFKWQMNNVTGGKLATVLQCGGWENAFEAAANARCVDEPVTPEFREGIRSGAERFQSFFEIAKVDVQDVAPMVTDGAMDRVKVLEKFAEDAKSIDYDQRDLSV